jgi:hypothetical protein
VNVVVDLAETERFEPPRGPWADVSGGVPAVDDHGAGRIEDRFGLVVQPSKRDVDRPWEVVLPILGRGKDLDELRTFGHQTVDVLAVDDLTRHGLPPSHDSRKQT